MSSILYTPPNPDAGTSVVASHLSPLIPLSIPCTSGTSSPNGMIDKSVISSGFSPLSSGDLLDNGLGAGIGGGSGGLVGGSPVGGGYMNMFARRGSIVPARFQKGLSTGSGEGISESGEVAEGEGGIEVGKKDKKVDGGKEDAAMAKWRVSLFLIAC